MPDITMKRERTAYASRIVLPPSLQGSLPAGWLSLYREGVEPSGSLQKVSDHPSSFSGLSLAQGKFHSITSSARARTVCYGRAAPWRRCEACGSERGAADDYRRPQST